MKNKKLIMIVSAVILIVFVAVTLLICKLSGCFNPLAQINQNINTTESTERINNPDQGFYHPIYVKTTESGISYSQYVITDATQLYHLRIDISAFSGKANNESDKLLTIDALNGIRNLLGLLRQRGKNAIVRFAYDPGFGGSANKEPETLIMYEHIRQVCPILNDFENTITAVEVGMVGPWGEMHTSTATQYITKLTGLFLDSTKTLPILVRTPKMIYNYLGINISDIDDYTIDEGSKAYRLGLYNDGYLGSSSDLGTYTNREKEIAFLSKQSDHLPFGGEVVIPNSPLHDIETCLPEMYQIHLNYLNAEWNNEVISKWKDTTYTSACGSDENYYGKSAHTYIENRMGYRLVLQKSVFSYSNNFDRLDVKLTIKNVGFGNLNKLKIAKLIFVDENGTIASSKDVGFFDGRTDISYSTSLSLKNGNYSVYLCLYGEEINNTPNYTLRFANMDMWNSTLNANKIGELKVEK